MSKLQRFVSRAAASRAKGFKSPVITSPEEARQLAEEVAADLARLPPGERLNIMTDLAELSQCLEGRVRHLEGEMSTSLLELEKLNRSIRACSRYAAAARLVTVRDRTRR